MDLVQISCDRIMVKTLIGNLYPIEDFRFEQVLETLVRHIRGDWGDISTEQAKKNEYLLSCPGQTNEAVISQYDHLGIGVASRIIGEFPGYPPLSVTAVYFTQDAEWALKNLLR